jgi:hypothetical protein
LERGKGERILSKVVKTFSPGGLKTKVIKFKNTKSPKILENIQS